jgi:hypothetical protein
MCETEVLRAVNIAFYPEDESSRYLGTLKMAIILA